MDLATGWRGVRPPTRATGIARTNPRRTAPCSSRIVHVVAGQEFFDVARDVERFSDLLEEDLLWRHAILISGFHKWPSLFWKPMVAKEHMGPATEGSLAIEERVVQIEEGETHESSIAE